MIKKKIRVQVLYAWNEILTVAGESDWTTDQWNNAAQDLADACDPEALSDLDIESVDWEFI